MPVPSDGVALGRITAGRKDWRVWVRRAPSAIAWGRCDLLRHLLQDPPSLGMHDRRHWRSQRRGHAHGARTGESDAV